MIVRSVLSIFSETTASDWVSRSHNKILQHTVILVSPRLQGPQYPLDQAVVPLSHRDLCCLGADLIR